MNRRGFLGVSALAASGAALARGAVVPAGPAIAPATTPAPKADAVILVWLPGGIAQSDMWDPKPLTPFRAGMKGSDLLSTCGPIPTAAKEVNLAKGLEHLAAVMDRGTVLRTVTGGSSAATRHLEAQYRFLTGYRFPPAVKAPSLGSIVSRTLGPKVAGAPPYFYLGRDATAIDVEARFIQEMIGPGFYGPDHSPILIPDPRTADSLLAPAGGATRSRADRRLDLLKRLSALGAPNLIDSPTATEYLGLIAEARKLADSPLAKALQYLAEENPETISAYEPEISQSEVTDQSYFHGTRFGHSLLLARRLIASGARFVQVEYPFARRKGFDTHENGGVRIAEMKKQIDRPIARLIADLESAGLLDRTLVVVASEFGRTVARQAVEPEEPGGLDGNPAGDDWVIQNVFQYGFHRHFADCSAMLFFGGGFKKGFAFGKTADRHPMLPVDNPVTVQDVYATILKSLGVPANKAFSVNGRGFYVTQDGLGKPIEALLAS